MFWFRKKRPYSEIDPGIAPLVSKMNATGVIRTIASCHGHICRERPYVYFEAPVEVAAAIEKRLRKADYNGEHWRHNFWSVEGCFYGDIKGVDEYKLVFTIQPTNHDENCFKLLWSLWTYFIMRKRLDAELFALANVVEEAVLLHLREKFKVRIANCGENQHGTEQNS